MMMVGDDGDDGDGDGEDDGDGDDDDHEGGLIRGRVWWIIQYVSNGKRSLCQEPPHFSSSFPRWSW